MTQLDSDIDRKIKELESEINRKRQSQRVTWKESYRARERNGQKDIELESDMYRKIQSQRVTWI